MNHVYLPEPVRRPTGHPHDPTTPDAEDLDDIINALMVEGAEYKPYSRANLCEAICEAICELPDDEMIALGRALRDAQADHVLAILNARVTAYWERLATMHAEKLVRNNDHCHI